MARNYYRTLMTTSLLASVGSFVIELGNVVTTISDRELSIWACVVTMALAVGGLVGIQMLRRSGWED